MSKNVVTYQIEYKYVDGAHFFTSNDPRVNGVCVANANPIVAYQEVTHQLSVITGHAIAPAHPQEAFLAWLNDLIEKNTAEFSHIPAAHIIWQNNQQAA